MTLVCDRDFFGSTKFPSRCTFNVAPAGYFFDKDNQLVVGVPTKANEKLSIWASPQAIYVDGTNQGQGNFSTGLGPVVLNTFVPTGAIATQVIPLFATDFTLNMFNTTELESKYKSFLDTLKNSCPNAKIYGCDPSGRWLTIS